MSPTLFFIFLAIVAPVLPIFLQRNTAADPATSALLRNACAVKNITANVGTRPLLCAFLNFQPSNNATILNNNNPVVTRPRYACVDYNTQTDAASYACALGDTCPDAYSALDPTATVVPGTQCLPLNQLCQGYFVCEETTLNGATSVQCPQDFLDAAGAQGICVLLPTLPTP